MRAYTVRISVMRQQDLLEIEFDEVFATDSPERALEMADEYRRVWPAPLAYATQVIAHTRPGYGATCETVIYKLRMMRDEEALAAAEAREKIRDHTVRVLAGCVQCRARERERAPRAGCSCGNCEVVRAALAVPPAQGPKEKP